MKMIKRLAKNTSLALVGLGLLFSQCSSSAEMSTAPVPIIAPVAGLISVSSPNAQGMSKVVGVAGAANPSVPVVITNQSSSVAVNATATSSGGFTAQLPAGVGNTVVFQQQTGQGLSENSDPKSVPANAPAISGSPVATDMDAANLRGLVGSVSPSANRTEISAVDLRDFIQAGDFFLDETLVFDGITANDFVFDPNLDQFYLVDNANNKAQVHDESGNLRGAAITVENPLSVTSDPDYQVAVIGQESSSDSITIIDGIVPAMGPSYLIPHPTNPGATHVRTFDVSADTTLGGDLYVGALSIFSNEDVVVSLFNANTATLITQVNLGNGTTGRIRIFDEARQAIITDAASNSAIHFTSNFDDFDTRVDIAVGNEPIGVAVDEVANVAFVTNSAGNTVSGLDLDDDSVAVTFDAGSSVGLGPVDISIVIDPAEDVFAAIVANEDGQTATLIDLEQAILGGSGS